MELKRGDRAREFIASAFPFSSKLKIWSFHVVVVQGQQKKRDARAELLSVLIKPIAFLTFC